MIQERSLGVILRRRKLGGHWNLPDESYLTPENGFYPNYMIIISCKPKHENVAELKLLVNLKRESQEPTLEYYLA